MSWKSFSRIFMGVQSPVERGERVQGAFYRGSRLLTPLADLVGIPIDQANFIISSLFCILLGQLMRHLFSPSSTHWSPRRRAQIELWLGVGILYFCFGNQLRVLFLQSIVAYALMRFLPPTKATAILVTLWSMLYLTLVHLCRLQYDYGGYTLDISGPVMVQTQRLSSLAFNLCDGATLARRSSPSSHRCKSSTRRLSDSQKEEAASNDLHSTDPDPATLRFLRRCSNRPHRPSLLRLLFDLPDGGQPVDDMSANGQVNDDDAKRPFSPPLWMQSGARKALKSFRPIFATPNVASLTSSQVGHAVADMPHPIVFFAYLFYFHGSSVGPFVFYTEYRDYLRGYDEGRIPPLRHSTVARLILQIVIAGFLLHYLEPLFPAKFMTEQAYLDQSVGWKIIYCTISLFILRQKYYFAFSLSEINGVSAGLDYNKAANRPVHSLVRNFDFWQIETALGLKHVVDNWNIATTRWFREVFYDRLPPTINTAFVFAVSAVWHGFYLGYYLMFATFALFTFVSRSWRRAMRLHCRRTSGKARVYDAFTRITTNLAINYAQIPFHLLDFDTSVAFWASFGFVPHLGSVALLLLLPLKARFLSTTRSSSSQVLNQPSPMGRTVGG